MQQALMVYPMVAMVLLTFVIGIWMLRLRIKAVKEGVLNPGYFLLNRGAKLPDGLAKVTQHYANLFEMPVLFYVSNSHYEAEGLK
ncbi:MAPEG family protein [Methylovulum psychrotolerans]|uniref:MAPEG family protein n=1 Tax=Methylovulum psychrotolerans TaxID=1704499 RepID=UPI001BFFA6BF|nr:MAPEG family protein [Methylovulum psychrotolerans]MBT9096440.1 MAPEG family protein [Methylovulum psychrotolerans]